MDLSLQSGLMGWAFRNWVAFMLIARYLDVLSWTLRSNEIRLHFKICSPPRFKICQ
jgi:hypothetical protein